MCQPPAAGRLTVAAVSRRTVRAFSLAELMIALAILAMGLLVIGAALPVGFRYTRDSINMATGEAAARFGLDLVEQKLVIQRQALDRNGMPRCEPGIFVPRRGESTDPLYPHHAWGEFIADYEPLIKVRPLYTQVIDATPGPTYGLESQLAPWNDDPNQVMTEAAIRTWLSGGGLDNDLKEADQSVNNAPTLLRPLLPSVAMVYPPITPDIPQYPDTYFSAMYEPRPVWTPPFGIETLKALERRVSWTAFYRRVLFTADDPDAPSYDPTAVGDPTLFELIVVALRVPDRDQHFPMQNPGDLGGTFAGLAAMPQSGGTAPSGTNDLCAPVPWLVELDTLPAPYEFTADGIPRPNVAGTPPATLTFTCDSGLDPLFPVGTMFIPARNDVAPHALRGSGGGWVDVGPPTASLPVYEVIARPDSTSVVTKYNGYYPRMYNGGFFMTPPGSAWPVWVVPPAARRDATGTVIWSNQSPILAVARRFVRVPEVP